MAKEKSKRSKRRAKRIPGGTPPGRAMPPITVSKMDAAAKEKADRIARGMTQIWDKLGLDNAIKLPEPWEDHA